VDLIDEVHRQLMLLALNDAMNLGRFEDAIKVCE
jgi:hypothetical protein